MQEMLPVVALMCILPAESGSWPEKQSDWRELSDLHRFKAGVLSLHANSVLLPHCVFPLVYFIRFQQRVALSFLNFLYLCYLFSLFPSLFSSPHSFYLPSHSTVVLSQYSHIVVMLTSNLMDRFIFMSKTPHRHLSLHIILLSFLFFLLFSMLTLTHYLIPFLAEYQFTISFCLYHRNTYETYCHSYFAAFETILQSMACGNNNYVVRVAMPFP